MWKVTVSVEFRANRLKLCGSCPFPQKFHTRKLGEIAVIYAVKADEEHPEIIVVEDRVPDVILPD